MVDKKSIKTFKMFLALTVVHASLFIALPFSFSEFNDRVNWFAINAIPWWPLYKLGLPVFRSGWMITPNLLGWIWCAIVWVVFYWFLSIGIIAFMTRRRMSGEG